MSTDDPLSASSGIDEMPTVEPTLNPGSFPSQATGGIQTLQPEPRQLPEFIALHDQLMKGRHERLKNGLLEALTNFTFSLGQGLQASAQYPGRRGSMAGMGAAMQGPQLLQQLRQQQQIAQEKQAAETMQAQAQMMNALTASQPKPAPFSLNPGSVRFGPDGRPIASVPANPPSPEPGFNLGPGQVRFGPDGKPIVSVPATEPTLVPEQVSLDGKSAIVMHDNAGNYFEIGGKTRITGRITPYVAPPTPRQKGEITPTAEAGLIQSLNRQWETAAKDVQALYRANTIMDAGMDAARKGDLNAGAQALLVTFQKFLDPQSVVRESEYARSAEGLSVASRVRGYVDRLSEGGAGVPLKELEAFAKLAKTINERLAGDSNSLLSAEKRRIESIADRYGIPSDMVVTRYDYAVPGGIASLKQQAGLAVKLASAKVGEIVTVPKSQTVPSGKVRKTKDGFEAID